ncbi:hypothetical protein ILFOPFJJ_02469 [Ensifer psoraleae]|nr:hypothetical protein [Sinorhizobium psoraleae]
MTGGADSSETVVQRLRGSEWAVNGRALPSGLELAPFNP